MPCPYFEPRNLSLGSFSNARLPLIDRYDGVCHARAGQPLAAPFEMLGGPCNHGYSHGTCNRYPADKEPSAMRYSVVGQSEQILDLLCVEEAGYAPVRWHALRYRTATGLFETDPGGDCIGAQAAAFCRSYLERPRS